MAVLVDRSDFREALFLASPELEGQLAELGQAPDSERGKRLESSLVRYLARACGRATPFGLFAGCSFMALGTASKLLVSPPEKCERKSRLDMGYLDAVVSAFVSGKDSLGSLLLFPNDTVYSSADGLRYVETAIRENERSYELVAVKTSDHLLRTLERAASGATADGLAAALIAEEPELTLEEAKEFVRELVESQLLVPDLRLAITGDSPVKTLLRELDGRDGSAATVLTESLRHAVADLKAIDAAGPGASRHLYADLVRSLQILPVQPPTKNLVQVDMARPAPEAQLGSDVVRELKRGAAAVELLSADAQGDALRDFKRAFSARYEDREVPLVEVLDEDAGIGFDSSDPTASQEITVRGMAFPAQPPGNPQMTPGQMLIARKLSEGDGVRQDEIELTEEEIASCATRRQQPLPAVFSVVARLAATSDRALADGEFTVYVQAITPGVKLLGRFCHVLPDLPRALRTVLEAEKSEAPHAMHAEVVHLPAGRQGNVLARPVLREHEIPFLGKSGAARTNQISVSDLLVSIRGERVVLRSASTGREVRPHQTTAHNFMRGLATYRFLCALENQGKAFGSFSLGPLTTLTYAPRIRHGRLILSLRRWNFTRDHLSTILSAAPDGLFEAVAHWREKWRLPRHVVLVEGDNELPVDLEQVLSLEGFIRLISTRSRIVLAEMFPSPSELIVNDGSRRYVAEFIVPFARPLEQANTLPALGPRCTFTEQHHPGGRWVYAKLHSGTAGVDTLIKHVLPGLVRDLRARSLIERWFFIRYGDPDWHLRLRFKASSDETLSTVVPAIRKSIDEYLSDGTVWRMEIDTYQPEYYRYGGQHAMHLAEEVFEADSDTALSILGASPNHDLRSALFWGLSQYPGDFGLSPTDSLRLWQVLKAEFGGGFGDNKSVEDQLSRRYRRERQHYEQEPVEAVHEALTARAARLRSVAVRLKALEEAGSLTSPLQSIVGSFIHMSANRMLRASARAQELVLYDFLLRGTRSRHARQSAIADKVTAST
jgi:thiopeptide-type bacteriocin biosynthesis protein